MKTYKWDKDVDENAKHRKIKQAFIITWRIIFRLLIEFPILLVKCFWEWLTYEFKNLLILYLLILLLFCLCYSLFQSFEIDKLQKIIEVKNALI
ncbi:MAG: hypothetical protein LBV69_05375 [Bacteroidales bacterium]|nr:hypothetical protein [Bacteroidales bacterium]